MVKERRRRRGGGNGDASGDGPARDRRDGARDGDGTDPGAAAGAPGRGSRGRQARRSRETAEAPVDGGTARLVPDPDRPHAWSLLVDGAPQSHVDLDDPTRLDFHYQRRLGHVADLAGPAGRPLHVLHLGGGALTLARYVAATRPRSTQQVLETDAALTAFVRERLPLERGARVRVRAADAREGLGRLPEDWADLVIADVFGGARAPAHLTSVEFLHEVRRVLRPGGLYAANITDGPGPGARADGGRRGGPGLAPPAHLRAQVATAGAVFGALCLIADPAVLRGRRFGNGVLVAGDGPLPVAELSRRAAGDPHTGRAEHGAALADFVAGALPVTDATARPSPAPPPGTFDS